MPKFPQLRSLTKTLPKLRIEQPPLSLTDLGNTWGVLGVRRRLSHLCELERRRMGHGHLGAGLGHLLCGLGNVAHSGLREVCQGGWLGLAR